MKMLILGIDGLGWQDLRAFGFDRLAARLERGVTATPAVENINSRGWCEIYSGADCYRTGAFFQVPIRNRKGVQASQNTGAPRVAAHVGESAMLWHRLNALGHSVCLFTVPTVTKPIELNGFSVAGTGGGSFGGGLGADSVYPGGLFRHRNAANTDLGFRYGFGAFQPASMAELEAGANAHLALFFHQVTIALAAKPVDVAWIGTRFVTELAYKFFSLVTSEPTDPAERALKDLVLALAHNFDVTLDAFIKRAAPEALFVVSDHGLGHFTHRINLNQALVDLGLLAIDERRTLVARARYRWRRVVSDHKLPAEIGDVYKFRESKAFSIGYTNLIYVNDKRFHGPVMSNEARRDAAGEIAERLAERCRGEPGMDGVTFTTTDQPAFTDAPPKERLPQPDIRIHFPNGLANLGTRRTVSQPNVCDFGAAMFARGVPGEYSGIKTDDTLSAYVGPHADLVKQERLTDLYDSILAVAERLA